MNSHETPDSVANGAEDRPTHIRVRRLMSKIVPRILKEGFVNEAAVLIPIFEIQGEPHFLLTRRTEEVQTHKGQISFPGGMRDGSESLERTALRETYEEVGINDDGIEILGRYHDYISSTDYRVSPFAGYLAGPLKPKPQVTEVAEVLYVPFRIFRDPALMRTEQWHWKGRDIEVCFYTFGPHEIWGLTARIIRDFLKELDHWR